MIIGVDYGVCVCILICEVMLIYCPYSSYNTYNNVKDYFQRCYQPTIKRRPTNHETSSY